MTDSRGCEHEDTKVETASNGLNGVGDPEGATLPLYYRHVAVSMDPLTTRKCVDSARTTHVTHTVCSVHTMAHVQHIKHIKTLIVPYN